MRTPLFSRVCSVTHTGVLNLRSFVLPIAEVEKHLVKKIETRIEDNKLIVKYYVGSTQTQFSTEELKLK